MSEQANIKEQLEAEFRNRKVSITLFPEKTIMRFDEFQRFYDFIAEEKKFWGGCGQSPLMGRIWSHFDSIFNELHGALQQSNFNSAIAVLNTVIAKASKNKFPAVYSVTAIAKFIKGQCDYDWRRAEAACQYLFNVNENLEQIQNLSKHYFAGYVSAFFNEEVSSENMSAETKALEDLRGRYVKELDDLHAKYQEKRAEYDKNRADVIAENDSFREELSDWKSGEQKNLETFLREKQEKLVSLENTYADKLRLEAPAKYWEELSEKYDTLGAKWKKGAIASSAFLAFILALILYLPPELLVREKFSISGLRGTIILALIVSIGAYVVRLFVKLSMSAYHLSRDARERQQLTHVYLSLLHEKGVSEADRNIILQALFSRADTGLLKGDAGPTMPSGPLDNIFKNLKGDH